MSASDGAGRARLGETAGRVARRREPGARVAPKRGLFRKYVLCLVTLVGGILLASGLIEVYYSYRENAAALVALQQEKANAASRRIAQYVQSIVDEIRWSARPTYGEPDERVARQRLAYLALLRKVPAVTDVIHIDEEGREQLRVSRLAMDVVGAGTDYRASPELAAARSGAVYYGPVYFRQETEPYMRIALAGQGAGAPVTAVELNLKFIRDVVSDIRIGKAGSAFVVDASGDLIAHPDISRVLARTNLSALPHVRAALDRLRENPPTAAPAGQETAIDAEGTPVLAASSVIDALSWLVFVEQPRSEAFAPVRASALRTGGVLVVGLALAVLVSLLLARRLVTPVAALAAGAAQLGAGRLDRRIELATGDELEGLAERFNEMAGRLQESYATLEGRVEERTHELSETLERQTATSEVLRVISSSPTDLSPVFEAILASATRLCDASLGTLFLSDDRLFRAVAVQGGERAYREFLARAELEADPDSALGRAVGERRPVHIADVTEEEAYAKRSPLRVATAELEGARTLLMVPLLQDGDAIGAIAVYRREVRPFTPAQIELLTTFSDQAVIAVRNTRLFRELEDKSRELEAANRHKSEFLANMSHELRTPLNAVIGFSEVLQQRMFGELNEKQAEYIDDIHSSGRHLLSLINDILDLSKIEAGRMELDVGRYDLRAALDNALILVRERAAQHGITVELDFDERLGEMVGDERKLKQILLNLLSNAVKFTPSGGQVRVEARRRDGRAEIAVTDTGIGIAAEDQEMIFEEFRQVGSGYSQKSEGTGLGLTLTRRFVEMQGGTMRVESEPGQGSCFTFTLPLEVGEPPREAAAASD